jgi:hypothetical protein
MGAVVLRIAFVPLVGASLVGALAAGGRQRHELSHISAYLLYLIHLKTVGFYKKIIIDHLAGASATYFFRW